MPANGRKRRLDGGRERREIWGRDPFPCRRRILSMSRLWMLTIGTERDVLATLRHFS